MPEGEAFIDRLRASDGSLDRDSIRKILPYGDPFLFVDEVSLLTETRAVATYRIPRDAEFLRAHFEDLPLMPGVLVGEGLAQTGTLVVRYNLDDPQSTDLLAYQIESALFPAPALPGETLRFEVEMLNLSRRAARLQGEASVGERRVCKLRAVLAIMPRADLEARLGNVAGES